jgi:tryptophan synthase beta subunit
MKADRSPHSIKQMTKPEMQPDEHGHWGRYGGRYVPETLLAPLEELTAAYLIARADACSRLERAPGIKDQERLRAFVTAVRRATV